MTVQRWARVAAVCSAATLVLFTVALIVFNAEMDDPRTSGPYRIPLRVVVIAAGTLVAGVMAWRYERLARGRVEGRPRWRVFTAWWALVVITIMIVTFPRSPFAVAAWVAALGWGVAATSAARLDRRTHS